jgi:branched-chain amino acid transport system permease protein
MFTYSLLAGLLFGLYFSLIGLGLNLIFGVMRIVNLAHGDFLMLGAFLAFWLFTLFAINPVPAIPIAFVGFAIAGVPIYYLLVPRLLRAKDPEMLSFILFFGIAQMIDALTTMVFGADQRSLPEDALGAGSISVFGQSFPDSWYVAAAASVLVVVGLYLYFTRTRLGFATRAIMASRDEALATGIDVNRVSMISFVIGLALAGVAGVFVPYMLGSLSPDIGNELTTTSFAVIIIGSLGNPLGTGIGGLVFGIGTLVMQTFFPSWSNLVPYALLVLIVLVRPAGLLGKSVRIA